MSTYLYNTLSRLLGLFSYYGVNSIIITLIISIVIIAFKVAIILFVTSLIIKSKTKIIYKSKLVERKAKTLDDVTTSIIKYLSYIILVLIGLAYLNIDPKSIIAIAGIGTVAIGFATQSIVKDFIIGSFILFEDQIGVGDLIKIEEHTGVVTHIGMRTISIRSLDGDLHIIPNSEIKVVINMSSNFKCAVVEIPINYNVDINKAIDILKDEMKRSYDIIQGLNDIPVVDGVTKLGNCNVTVRIIADCKANESYTIEREIRRLVKSRFDKENFPPPYSYINNENFKK